jgi:hypothetical protein
VIGAFNSVYAALRGFFSQGFWFATFLPVTVFAALHVVVAICVVGPINLPGLTLSFENPKFTGDVAVIGLVVVLALVVVGYALLPLMPHFRGLLDGSQLPEWLHQWLRPQRLAFARATRRGIKDAFDDIGSVSDLRDDAHDDHGRLPAAYQKARSNPSAQNQNVVNDAKAELGKFQAALSAESLLAPVALNAVNSVLLALALNNPDPQALAGQGFPLSADEIGIATETNKVADDLEELLNEATREAIYRREILRTRNRVTDTRHAPRWPVTLVSSPNNIRMPCTASASISSGRACW